MGTGDPPRSLREWQGGGTTDTPAPEPALPTPGLWWRVSYAPVGNLLTVALMDGDGPKARVLALESILVNTTGPIIPLDRDVMLTKEILLERYRESHRLIAAHSGPCFFPPILPA